jgi:hypothetical protein
MDSKVTYGVKILRNGEVVDNADTAQSVLINVHGGGNVVKFLEGVTRWDVTLPTRVMNRIERVGLQKAINKAVGQDAVVWS